MTKMSELSIIIKAGESSISGDLTMPGKAKGIVLFAHGSGSSRFSPRNRYVAKFLNQNGFGTLLIDLLTPEEEKVDEVDSSLRFDIPLLRDRLLMATDWLIQNPRTSNFEIGYFGASTGAAAALMAAPERPQKVKAIMSRGGRPDLAGEALVRVKAATLLIVGGYDHEVLELNQGALIEIPAKDKKLEIVPHATHLFEEPGALEKVAELAANWFQRHLGASKVHGKRAA